MITTLKEESIDIAFNLARNDGHKNYDRYVSAICELLEIKTIGPNIFSSAICNSEQILSQVLKNDKIRYLNTINSQIFSNLIQIYLLGDNKLRFFFNLPKKFTLPSSIAQEIIKICKKCYNSIHGTDYCKFTMFLEENRTPYLLKINLMPLLGKINDFANLASLEGIEYDDFINFIILNNSLRHNLSLLKPYLPLKNLFETKSSIFNII